MGGAGTQGGGLGLHSLRLSRPSPSPGCLGPCGWLSLSDNSSRSLSYSEPRQPAPGPSAASAGPCSSSLLSLSLPGRPTDPLPGTPRVPCHQAHAAPAFLTPAPEDASLWGPPIGLHELPGPRPCVAPPYRAAPPHCHRFAHGRCRTPVSSYQRVSTPGTRVPSRF